MNSEKGNSQPSGGVSSQPSAEFFTGTMAVTFLKSLYDVGKDTGLLFGSSKPFYQVISSEFDDNKHVIEFKLNNTSSHSIKILALFEKGKRALTDKLSLVLREREQHFPNGNFTNYKYYEDGGYRTEKPPTIVNYPLLIESNYSYRIRISLPLKPKPAKEDELGVTLICMVADLDKLKNREEKITVRLFWPD